MYSKNEINSLISDFLDKDIIFVPQIDAFEKMICSVLKNKGIRDFFQMEMKKVRQKVKNGKIQKTEKPLKRPSRKTLSSKSKPKVKDENKGKKGVLMMVRDTQGKQLHIPLKDLSVIERSQKLQRSPASITRILKQKGYTKNESDKLNNEEYDSIKEFAASRLKAISRTKKIMKNVLKGKITSGKHIKTSKKSAGVYDKIATYGLGKVIYIRSR